VSHSHEQHEALCRRCGQSCHFAIEVNGRKTIVDDLHCRFLERHEDGKFSCSVYERRFEVAPWCHTVDEALKDGLLANDCPYARNALGFQGKRRVGPESRLQTERAIREQILVYGVPPGISHDGLARFLDRTGDEEFFFELSPDGSRLMIRKANAD
jgi:hypothetical protein